MKLRGMHGTILSVDLTTQTIETPQVKDAVYHHYLGGRGLGVHLFTSNVSPDIEPLSSVNQLVFTTGPLTSTIVPTSGRFSLVTKSPLTGFILYSNTGGSIGPALKSTGFDGLIIKGKSESPVYLRISSDGDSKIVDCKSVVIM